MVTPIMPNKTAVPRDWRISAPAPWATASGATPRMKANDVIKIGRRRVRAEWTAASSAETPSSSSRCLANSTIRIAFLAANPTKNVDRHASNMKTGRRCQETHRHNQHNRQRQLPAFVLRCEDQEYKQGGGSEYQQRWCTLLVLLIGQVGPLVGDAERECSRSDVF